jgi:hypothetical protein
LTDVALPDPVISDPVLTTRFLQLHVSSEPRPAAIARLSPDPPIRAAGGLEAGGGDRGVSVTALEVGDR